MGGCNQLRRDWATDIYIVVHLRLPYTISCRQDYRKLENIRVEIFHTKKFRVKNFIVTGGLNFNMLAEGWHHLNSSGIRARVRDLAWRSSEEIVAFAATMYIKRCGRQLLEKCCIVWESCTTFKVDMPWLWKKKGTTMGHLPRRLSRVCSFFLRHGGTISCAVNEGRRYSIDLYIALTLTFVYYTVHNSTHVIIVP